MHPHRFVFFLIFLLLPQGESIYAQWIQTNEPYLRAVPVLLVSPTSDGSGSNLFAGTWGGGVFLSTNDGASWTTVNSGLTDTTIYALAVSGTNLFAGTHGGAFLSTNNGLRWTKVDSGLTNPVVESFAVSGSNLFAGTDSGVFLSTNHGASWTNLDSGLIQVLPPFAIRPIIWSLAVFDSNLFAGTPFGAFISTNNGTSWAPTGLKDTNVKCFAVIPADGGSGTNLFAATWNGVFLSTNNGTSWTRTALANPAVKCFAVSCASSGSGTNLFAGTVNSGVFLSTNNGTSWTEVNSGLTITDVQSLAVSGAYLFAGTYGGGVWRRPLDEIITSVRLLTNEPLEDFILAQNYPNPFNPSTTIRYELPKSSHVTLKVFDVLGKQVATLVNDVEEPGYKSVEFDGSQLSSGVYFYQLQAGDFMQTKKFLLLQ